VEPRPYHVPQTYSVQEVAAILRRSQNSVRDAIKRGEIPGRQIGRKFSIPKRTFDDWYERFEEPARRRSPRQAWS
jgi:excisionase family DNA binding protein